MQTRDGISTLPISSILSTSLRALLGASAAFCGLAALMNHFDLGSRVAIDLGDWQWMTQVKLGIDHPMTSATLAATEVAPRVNADDRMELMPRIPHRLEAEAPLWIPAEHHVMTHSQRRLANVPVKRHHAHPVSIKVAVALPTAPIVVAPTAPQVSEASKMQAMHAALHVSFTAAVTMVHQRPDTQLAVAALDNQFDAVPEIAMHPYEELAAIGDSDAQEIAEAERDELTTQPAAPIRTTLKKRHSQAKKVQAQPKAAQATDLMTVAMNTQVQVQPAAEETAPRFITLNPTITPDTHAVTGPLAKTEPAAARLVSIPREERTVASARMSHEPAANPAESDDPADEFDAATSDTPAVQAGSLDIHPQSELGEQMALENAGKMAANLGYPVAVNGIGYSAASTLPTVSIQRPVSQAGPGPAPFHGGQPDKTPSNVLGDHPSSPTPDAKPAINIADKSAEGASSHHRLATLPKILFIEGLADGSPLFNAASTALTQETPGEFPVGWELASAPGHWPTLSWTSDLATPLISNTAILLLSRVLGTSAPEKEAGVVFGNVPAGWTVELSGRSEKPLFLNSQHESVPATHTTAPRDFVFMNVAPGAQILYLVGPLGKSDGAVALPVMAGTATFIDLSSREKHTVSGKVFDSSPSGARALRNVQVRVVGQNASASTAADGSFEIQDVTTIGAYPMFIETEVQGEFTHRYRFTPAATKDLALYRLSAAQISDWLDQLEGGISADSGLVVAATPNLVAEHGDGELFPSLHTLQSSGNLRPETYTVSTTGQLQINTPLQGASPRFVSVQISEGPAVVELENKSQKTVWSELVVSQPGIVNVVGPR